MRGEVLKPDDADGAGIIVGEDGHQYSFVTAQVHKSAALAVGTEVDFFPIGAAARDVHVPQVPMPTMAEAAAAAPRPRIIRRAPTKASPVFVYYLNALSKNYARFKGRARRAEYWSFTLLSASVFILTIILDTYISDLLFRYYGSNEQAFEPIISGSYFLYTLIPSLSILIRRLHDAGRNGWVAVVAFVPYVGIGWLFFLLIDDSAREASIHGESPKYSEA